MTTPVPTRSLGPRASGARPAIPSAQQGYIMLIAIFLMALLVISLAIAAPEVAKSIQRDKDLETFHRGLQYRRAIQLYYRQFHAYPPNAQALTETNNVRFLRKQYIDPISNKSDWKPVLFGQNKTPTAMGFFGQPLAGSATTIAGTGPSGGNSAAGSGSSGGILPGGISSLFGGSSSSSTASPVATGSGDTSGAGSSSSSSSATSSTTTGSATPGTASAGTSASTSSSPSGQTFGGAGVIGFEPASPRQSILIYKKKNHYNEWEFTYDPLSDMQTMNGGSAGAAGQPASSTTSPVGSSTFGSSTTGSSTFGSSTFGSSTFGSSTPGASSAPATPQP